MDAPENPSEIAGLYRKFSASFRANDDEAVRRIYRELLRIGRPRAEILDEAARLSMDRSGKLAMEKLTATPKATEASAGIGRSTGMVIAAAALRDGPKDGSAATLSPPYGVDLGVSDSAIPESTERTSQSIVESAQGGGFGEVSALEAERKIAFLSRPRLVLFACAFGGVAVILISCLVLLPNPSTAENTTPAASAAPVAAAARNPIATAITPSDLRAPASSVSAKGQQEPINAPAETTVARGAIDLGSIKHATASEPNGPRPDATAGNPTTGSPPVAARHTESTAIAAASVTSTQEQPISSGNVGMLLARGDSLFGTGDLASARLFYERAATAGSGEAALRLGESYDSHFLERTHLRGARGDTTAAILWYTRARDLGVGEATILLDGLRESGGPK